MRPLRPMIPALALCALLPASAGAVLDDASPRLRRVLEQQMAMAEERPQEASVHNDLGNLLLLAGDPEGAEAAYRRALELEPKLASASYNLALLLHNRGKRRAAVRRLKGLVKHHPNHALAHYELGVLQSERGRKNRAVRRYARAFELDPELTDPNVNPHVLRNRFVERAMLTAYLRRPDSDFMQRQYEEGMRIAAQLVGGTLTATPADETAEAEASDEAASEPEAEAPAEDGANPEAESPAEGGANPEAEAPGADGS